jgi:hypothetical protein
MGLTELPVIILSGLSETQKRTLRIADNEIALNAGWDLEILQLELLDPRDRCDESGVLHANQVRRWTGRNLGSALMVIITMRAGPKS